MKKIISYLIAMMMVFTMMPYTAFAAANQQVKEEPIGISLEPWVNPDYQDIISEEDLNREGEPISLYSSDITYATTPEEGAAVMREYMVNRVESFMIYYKFPREKAEAVGDGTWFDESWDGIIDGTFEHTGVPVEGDYLRKHYGGLVPGSISIVFDENYENYLMSIPITVTVYTDYDQEEAVTAAVDELLDEIITDGMTDYQKVKAIYDYMTSNIVYDYDNLNDGSYMLKYTAYAALINKTSVCQGYASLFYRLALECGIDARYISGQSVNSAGQQGRHGWNIVKLGSKYYLLDATWDAGRNNYGYFLKASYTDHFEDEEYRTSEFTTKYPMTAKDYVACTEHTAEVLPAVPATCDEYGLTEGSICANCGEVLKAQEQITSLGHSYDNGAITKEPTTTETGVKTYTCERCGDTKNEDIPKLEPEPESGIALTGILLNTDTLDLFCDGSAELTASKLPADTTNTDSITWKSSDTSVVRVYEDGYVQAFNVGTAVITAAAGDIKATCKVTVTHNWGEWNISNPNCIDTGNKWRMCKDCYESEVETIPATGIHDWSEWTTWDDATCSEDGYKERYCSDCGKTEEEVIPATGIHRWSSWVRDSYNLCSDSEESRYCKDCYKEETKDSPATKEHDWGEWYGSEGNCLGDGLKWRYCNDCFKCDEEISPATDEHDWGEWTTWDDATCSEDGYKERYCSDCGKTEEEVIPATGIHRWSSWVRDSYNLCSDSEESRYCKDCYKEETKDSPATKDHDWGEWEVEEEATCIDGHKERYCTYCDERDEAVIPATGEHDWSEWEPIDSYTCSDRNAYRYCNDCSKKEKTVIPATTDHEWDKWEVGKEATCIDGYKERYCTYCDERDEAVIPATGDHDWGEWTPAGSYTCIDRDAFRYCHDCDKHERKVVPATTDHDWSKWTVRGAKCAEAGYKWRECCYCWEYEEVTIPAKGHKWESNYTIDKKATTNAAGSKSKHCVTCNAVKSGSKVAIAKIKNVTAKTVVYNGKNQTKNVTVTNGKGKKLVKGTDFTVTYKNAKGKVVTPKNVGTYKAVVKFKGQYSGTVTKTFKINPQGTKITKFTKNGKKQFTVKWTKKTAQVTGYQIKYSTKQNMGSAKIATVKNAKTTSRTFKQLKAKKKYYVQIRTYKNVNGTKYFSAWSAKKTVTTK